jgi:hypothetical protein
MNFERESSIQRVVGNMPQAYKEGVLNGARNRFRDQVFEELEGKEKQKTPEQIQLIQDVDVATNELLTEYDLPEFSVPPENIHVISDNNWDEVKGSAFFNPSSQAIAVREGPMNTAFMTIIFHEMLHFKSYGARQADGTHKERNLRNYRLGLTIDSRNKDEKKRFFTAINEAVTEELTKKHARKLLYHPLLREEIRETNRVLRKYPQELNQRGKPLFTQDTYCATGYIDEEWRESLWRSVGISLGLTEKKENIVVQKFGYPEERAALDVLVNRIFQQNKGDFESKEEVFEVFAKAMMTGNILTLGKLVDKTFGEGTFRDIGEFDDNVKDLAKYVNTL